MTDIRFEGALAALEAGPLPEGLVEAVFSAVLAGAWTEAQIAGFLIALRQHPTTHAVLTEAARALRAAMVEVPHQHPKVLDTCGTGGDGQATLNLSTGAAIIAAAHGVVVAKHGNRAVSSRSGSADVLEALGVSFPESAEHAARQLSELGLAFLMAPVHHPAMRFVAPVRRALGVRTLFNCLGPLANPARATHQLLGAYSEELLPTLAAALLELGVERAWVVRSADGLDELSPFTTTQVCELHHGEVRRLEVHPRDFGLPESAPGALAGGDAEFNAAALRAVLSGAPHPARTGFLLNAAAALVVAEELSPPEAARRAAELVDTGAALALLERWREAGAK